MRFLFIILLFSINVQAQTRLYFSSTESAPVSPPIVNPGSLYDVTEATRWKLNNTKGSSAITTGTQIGPFGTTGGASGNQAIDRQHVSTRMDAGITFTNGTTTAKVQLMVREYANTDNVDRLLIFVQIYSEDGSTLRASYSGFGNTAAEFINNATHRNQSVPATTLSGGSNYTTVLGDRLVVTTAFLTSVGGTTPEASAKYGENATDLPENSTQTTDGAGWIEFSNTITFAGEVGPTRRVTIIQ